MTSLSRRKRRTTPWTGTGRRTGISLAALLAAGGGVLAQPPAPTPPPGKPAPTQWVPYPQPAVEMKPLPQLTPLAPPPAMPALAPPTVTYQKPAGEQHPVVSIPPAAPVARPNEPLLPAVPLPQPEVAPPPRVPVRQPGDKTAEPPAPALPSRPGGLPTREDVFRLESDPALNRRILRDLSRPLTDRFPERPALVEAGTVYVPKTAAYPPLKRFIEPNYVVHRRLYFEERNAERYGWDAGPLQAVISTAYFYHHAFWLPHNIAAGGCRDRFETSAGQCLPGDPVPYLAYPPGFTPFGLLVQGGFWTGMGFVFPGLWGYAEASRATTAAPGTGAPGTPTIPITPGVPTTPITPGTPTIPITPGGGT